MEEILIKASENMLNLIMINGWDTVLFLMVLCLAIGICVVNTELDNVNYIRYIRTLKNSKIAAMILPLAIFGIAFSPEGFMSDFYPSINLVCCVDVLLILLIGMSILFNAKKQGIEFLTPTLLYIYFLWNMFFYRRLPLDFESKVVLIAQIILCYMISSLLIKYKRLSKIKYSDTRLINIEKPYTSCIVKILNQLTKEKRVIWGKSGNVVVSESSSDGSAIDFGLVADEVVDSDEKINVIHIDLKHIDNNKQLAKELTQRLNEVFFLRGSVFEIKNLLYDRENLIESIDRWKTSLRINNEIEELYKRGISLVIIFDNVESSNDRKLAVIKKLLSRELKSRYLTSVIVFKGNCFRESLLNKKLYGTKINY